MLMKTIRIKALNQENFAPFGEVIEATEQCESYFINEGNCRRYHNLAKVEAKGENAKAIISIFRAKPISLPFELKMMERHPFGSQSFMPLSPSQFLVIVAKNENGKPASLQAFLANIGQGVNIDINVWHAPLCALKMETDFFVVDRDGAENNLETYDFENPYRIEK